METAADSLEMMVGAYQSALNHAVVTFPLKDKKHPLKQKSHILILNINSNGGDVVESEKLYTFFRE